MNFYEDKNGLVWVATYGGGLNRFDPKTEKFNTNLKSQLDRW